MHIDTDRAPGSPHRRFNPLTGEWVLVSPQRTDRPWQGQVDAPTRNQLSPHDPSCYLCPGNRRSGGQRNPSYTGTYVFPNDFPALVPEGDGEYGICRVMCYSPRHDLGFGELPLAALENVVETWTEQYAELGADPRIGHVQIFENRGQQMGASNPHPHGQIWATEHVPTIVAREQENLGRAPVLADYVKSERDRIVVENEHFLAVVPYWANLALRNPGHRSSTGSLPDRSQGPRTRGSFAVAQGARHAVRRSVRDAVPLLDGYPPGPDVRRLAGQRVSPSSPLLPATLAIGEHPKVHGRIRASRRSAARPQSRRSRRAASSGEAVIVARAPGRVNLIGEHTDYNEGFVMPIAIDRGTTVTAISRRDRTVTVEALELRESDRFSLDRIEATGSWRDYVRGVVGALSLEHGVDLRIESDLPRGAGLSSSAALEIAVASALSAAPARRACPPRTTGGERVRRRPMRDHGPADGGNREGEPCSSLGLPRSDNALCADTR